MKMMTNIQRWLQNAVSLTVMPRVPGLSRGRQRNSWSLIGVALAACLVMTLPGRVAVAQQPGESSNWSAEKAGGNQIFSSNVIKEARNPILDVWVANDSSGQIWASEFGGGNPIAIPNATTRNGLNVSVVPFGQGYAIFWTGRTNSNIYWYFTTNAASIYTPGAWQLQQLPGNFLTNLSPGATQVTAGGSTEQLMLAWTGTDGHFYSSFFNGASGWSSVQGGPSIPIDDALVSGPACSTAHRSFQSIVIDEIDCIMIDQRSNVRRIIQDYGSSTWDVVTPPANPPNGMAADPAVAVSDGGNMQLAVPDFNGHIWFNFNDTADQWTGWTQDPTHWVVFGPVTLSTNPGTGQIYAIMRGAQNAQWYKLSFNDSNVQGSGQP